MDNKGHYTAFRDWYSSTQNLATRLQYDDFGNITTMRGPNTTVHYIYDGYVHGYPTAITDTFGNDIIPKYSFNAKELDEETGMYYYEARYYKPPVFTSRDPMIEKKPWLSPYHYCSNNPVGRVDPSGYDDDWYQNEDGTVGWTEGHAATVVDVNGKRYRNIGETYSVLAQKYQ